jgi:type IV secretory pathway VirB2 component (pilin)
MRARPILVAMRTKDGVASLSDLVRSSLRLRPDRIPIGEVRGAEALDLLKAWGTGHPGGVGTIHAGSAIGALRRMEQLIQEAVVTVPRALIAETIDLIAVLVRDGTAAASPNSPASTGSGRSATTASPPATQTQGDPMIHALRRAPIARARCHRSLRDGGHCRAGYAGGSSMPWEAPLQSILEIIEGPVAKIVAVIIIIVTGLTLAFGDTSGGFRRLIQIVFGLSIAFAASSFLPVVLQLRRRSAGLMTSSTDDIPGLLCPGPPRADRADPARRCAARTRHRQRHAGGRDRPRPAPLARGLPSGPSAMCFRSGPPSAIRSSSMSRAAISHYPDLGAV